MRVPFRNILKLSLAVALACSLLASAPLLAGGYKPTLAELVLAKAGIVKEKELKEAEIKALGDSITTATNTQNSALAALKAVQAPPTPQGGSPITPLAIDNPTLTTLLKAYNDSVKAVGVLEVKKTAAEDEKKEIEKKIAAQEKLINEEAANPTPRPQAQSGREASADAGSQAAAADQSMKGKAASSLHAWQKLVLRRTALESELKSEQANLDTLSKNATELETNLKSLFDGLNHTHPNFQAALKHYVLEETKTREAVTARDQSKLRRDVIQRELNTLQDQIPKAMQNFVSEVLGTPGMEMKNESKSESDKSASSTNDRYKATANYGNSDVERGHFAAHQVPVVRPLPLAVGYRGPWNDPAGIFQDGMPRLDGPTSNPTAENRVHRVVFTQPARFPRWEYDLAQTPLESEGLVVYEDMELVFTRTGQYEVRFSTSAPEVPVTLRLQFQLNKYENGYCASTNRLFTLPPIVIRPAAVADAASHGRDLVDERTRHAPRVVRHCGYSAALAKAFAAMPQKEIESVTCENLHEATGHRLERVGTARFGYGLLFDGAVAGN